jgi:hypothetical protein
MYLNKKQTRLAVRAAVLPATSSPILGTGIDVMTLPEGHLCCVKCGKHLFECWISADTNRIEMGCLRCNESYRLLFPMDVIIPCKFSRFVCRKHPNKGMVLIHNVDIISVGCESCTSEMQIKLKTKSNLVIAQ